ncbi:hypothetical protein [Deinococcus sp. PEB2-63]
MTVRRRGVALLVLAALAWGTVTAGPPCYGCAPVVLEPWLPC